MNTSLKSARVKTPASGAFFDPQGSEALLRDLTDDLGNRRIAAGISKLEQQMDLLSALTPGQPNAGKLLACLAQWVDVGYERPELVQRVLSRFPQSSRATLPVREYIHLQMADGFLAMSDEEPDEAIRHLDIVLTMGQEFDERTLLPVANFWKGRCLRRKGEYDEALTYTLRGDALAIELGYPRMAAVMRVLQSWLLFQKGRNKEALAILQQAESALRDTDDCLTLGNIYSSYGRIARRECRYEQAVDCFNKAIAAYRQRDPQHRNLARSFVNIAIVKRYVTLQLGEKIDAATRRKRVAAARGKEKSNGRNLAWRERLLQLRQEAFTDLAEAKRIYEHHPNHHGLGSVHVNSGYLHLDNGDYDRADDEAEAAYASGEEKDDHILMARARLLQCMIENSKLDEEVAEGPNPGSHARKALEAARDALELAKRTQNRRILAMAHVWQGLTESNEFLDDLEAAQHSYDLAMAALKGENPGNLAADLKTLKARLYRSGSVDATLRAWSQGLVGTKTFQQMVEEFADLVIPKVWEREERKISRVAERLSISPKKVRRVLNRAVRRGTRPSEK